MFARGEAFFLRTAEIDSCSTVNRENNALGVYDMLLTHGKRNGRYIGCGLGAVHSTRNAMSGMKALLM